MQKLSMRQVSMRDGRGPKYLFSSLLVCGQCQHKFVIVDPKRYACSGWIYRGVSVCSNTIKVSRNVVESVLLESIQRDLFTEVDLTVFKQEASRLLVERRRTQIPDRERASRRLVQVEHEIANIMKAIKAGILTPSTKAELERTEAERTKLLHAIQGQQRNVEKVAAFLPNVIVRFKALIDDLANVTQLQFDLVRELLRTRLGKEIVLHPTADGSARYLSAEVSGDYAGLLRLTIGQNNAGGGHPIQPSLAPLLRFKIQGVALAA